MEKDDCTIYFMEQGESRNITNSSFKDNNGINKSVAIIDGGEDFVDGSWFFELTVKYTNN